MSDHQNTSGEQSSSSTITPTETFTYTWTIPNLSQYFQENYLGQSTIYSNHFPAFNSPDFEYTNSLRVQFYLELVPDGEDEHCQDYVSTFLYLSSCGKQKIEIKYKFWIVDKHGRMCNIEENQRSFARGEGWGWREFIPRDYLIDPDNDLLRDDGLTISCEVTVIDDDIRKRRPQSREPTPSRELIEKSQEIEQKLVNEDEEEEQEEEEESAKKKSNSTSRQNSSDSSKHPPKIGKIRHDELWFEGSMFDSIDGTPMVCEDGKVDNMKSLWEYRKGKY